ncbi:MAG: ATP synthase F1 subunit gamma [Bacteroidales bacterium]|nr:ATP synthase F1 subunit gamma [Bacteroidales bacterium]
MANLKEIRDRRESVASTRQITSAMKMVAAAKLKKAQDAIIQLRPYAEKLQEILGSISDSLKGDEQNIYAQNRDEESILLVVITSNRGLCGAFNSNAIKASIHAALDTYSDQMMAGQVHFLAIGKKGADFLKKNGYNVIFNGSEIFDDLSFERSVKISEMIMDLYVAGDYDHVDIVYNQFKNAATQNLEVEQFLPIKMEELGDEEPAMVHTDFIFEPSKDYIMKEMVPRSLKLQFYKAIIDSFASEHGARMTAMHKATDNATEMMKDLALEYNKARQAAITNEIIEIVGGAEALSG